MKNHLCEIIKNVTTFMICELKEDHEKQQEACKEFFLQFHAHRANKCVKQGFSTLALKVHFPAEFSSNLGQTHLPVTF